jgi:hypothetical protein
MDDLRPDLRGSEQDDLSFPERALTVEAHPDDTELEALLPWAADEPDHWEEISRHLQQKIDALRRPISQHGTMMGNGDGDCGGHSPDHSMTATGATGGC